MKKYSREHLSGLKKLKFVEGSLEEESKEGNDHGKPAQILERTPQRSHG